jgi:hypothetical protein
MSLESILLSDSESVSPFGACAHDMQISVNQQAFFHNSCALVLNGSRNLDMLLAYLGDF